MVRPSRVLSMDLSAWQARQSEFSCAVARVPVKRVSSRVVQANHPPAPPTHRCADRPTHQPAELPEVKKECRGTLMVRSPVSGLPEAPACLHRCLTGPLSCVRPVSVAAPGDDLPPFLPP